MANLLLGRRAALLGLTAAFTAGRVSLALADAPTDKRFIVVILRGALDGMSAVVPYGDANLATWRPLLVPAGVGAGGMLDLGGFYGLNPDLAPLHDLYAAGELLPVHAIAGHYRSRSHFEAQDYMESGADHTMDSGWLNRVVTVLPASLRGHSPGGPALSVGLSMPLLLRGPATVGSWAPENANLPPPDLYARVAQLSAADLLVGPAIAEGLRERGFSAVTLASAAQPTGNRPDASMTGGPGMDPGGHAGMGEKEKAPRPDAFANLARTCGTLLSAANGPRIAALEVGGWDTHSAQAARLKAPLTELSTGLVALKQGLGDAWASTVVMVMTEFGRTVRQNGTNGTDHGTGTIAFALGGPIAGGRVLANWPGLQDANLLDGRDLQPTADLRSLAKGLLGQHLGLGSTALAQVFPDSAEAAPMSRLLRA